MGKPFKPKDLRDYLYAEKMSNNIILICKLLTLEWTG